MKFVFLLAILVVVNAHRFRFDYKWVDEARGWLKYHAVPAVWDEARLRCHAEGAVLASPLTRQLKSAMIAFLKKQQNRTPATIFIGVHASFSKGDYSSIEGVPLLRMPITWASGQPDNYANLESCLAMSPDGEMFDTSCSYVLPYVCYKEETHLTFNSCGTSDPGYILEPKTGSCYKLHGSGLVWSEAYMTCIAEGGYLAVIDNDEEGEVIKKIFEQHSPDKIQSIHKNSLSVGIHDWGRHAASFMTIHGQSLESAYHNWADGQPDNQTNSRTGDSGQYCGHMFRSGQLDDFFCNIPAAFICEMRPNSLRDN